MLGLLFALSLHVGPPEHPGGDSWFGADKVKHFFMSAFVQSVTYTGARAVGVGRGGAMVAASAATVGVGVGKEIHDRRSGGAFSARDLTWDLGGGMAAGLLLDRTRE